MLQNALNSLYYTLKNPQLDLNNNIFDELKGPDLIWVCPSYEKANPRVAIIDQQPYGCDYTYREFIDNWTIEKAVSTYKDFNFGENYTPSPFWQFFQEVRAHFFGEKDVDRGIVAWLNLVKFVTPNCEPVLWQPFEETALVLQDGIFNAELDIIKPDICFFVTGPYYDRVIERYYPGVVFQDFGLGERTLAKLVHSSLPKRSFRTYHPMALRMQGKWETVLEHVLKSA